MTVNPAITKHLHTHAGTTYFFCSAGCKHKFELDPETWLAHGPRGMDAPQPLRLGRPILRPQDQAGAQASADEPSAVRPARPAPIEYTCPMHPEIV
jgi:YHS domain-containing protein